MIEKYNHKIEILEAMQTKIASNELISEEITTTLAENAMIELKADLFANTNLLWNNKISEQIEIFRIEIEELLNENINPIPIED